MDSKTIHLKFEVCRREPNIGKIPEKPGIYVVYECSHAILADTLDLLDVVYIGSATNANGRIAHHEKWTEWRKHCGDSNQLCFFFAPIAKDRKRTEAALIYKHKPPVNDEYKHEFPFGETTIILSGKTGLLRTYFTVR
ncbi:MAG: GIY-YIG nuclease family protein [Planctomycetes bacterium]|nr:GIY-YIG nuclease family protein [Planctomycetota bacterium]